MNGGQQRQQTQASLMPRDRSIDRSVNHLLFVGEFGAAGPPPDVSGLGVREGGA